MEKQQARQRLARLWFLTSGLLMLLFVIYTATGRFDGHNAEGWQWYTQNLLPSLTLIATFFFSTHPEDKTLTIDIFAYKLAFGISTGYLIVLVITVLLGPVAFKYAHLSLLDLFKQSQFYLAIFQALVTGSIGWLFGKPAVAKSSKPNKPSNSGNGS